MKLHEALKIFCAADDLATVADQKRASLVINEELQKQGNWLAMQFSNLGTEAVEDVVQEVFLKIFNKKPTLDTYNEASARAFLKKMLRNGALDRFRKVDRFGEVALDDGQGNGPGHMAQEAAENRSSPAEELYELKEAYQQSTILDHRGSEKESRDGLYAYLKEVVLARRIRRRPARERARAAIDEMRQITDGDIGFEQLVDNEVDGEASSKKRAKIRNSIQKRHSRTRDRLVDWLESEGRKLIVENPSADGELTELDHRLLLMAVEDLRSRSASDGTDGKQ